MADLDSIPAFKGSILKGLAELFTRHSVQCVLVGGYALNVHNVQRMTFDVDFMITAKDYAKMEPDLLSLGYGVANRQDAFVQLKSQRVGLRDLDFLLGDWATVDGLVKNGQRTVIAGEEFIVPSVGHLIAMKLHSIQGNKARESKDLPDIVAIMKANDMDPTGEEFQQLCTEYGNADLRQRITKALEGAQ